MRVLLVNDFRAGGGAEVVVDETVRLLEGAGHEVERLTGEDVGTRRTPFRYVTNRRAVRALEARAASFVPDVVHFHNVYHVLSPAVLAAHLPAGTRRVATAHDFHFVCPNAGARCFTPEPVIARAADLRDAAWVRRQRWDHRSRAHGWLRLHQHRRHYVTGGGTAGDVRRRLDLVLCPGTVAADFLREAGLPVPVRVVPNPFDAEAVRREAAEAAPAGAAPSTPGTLRLVFAGRVEPEKGLGDLLDAWAGLDAPPPAVIDVLGAGSEVERCRDVRAPGLEVRCHGAVPRPRALATIAAADALLVPSRTPEVAPMVLLEALALDTAIVASDVGAVRELHDALGGDGGIVHRLDERDPGGSLAAALAALGRPRDATERPAAGTAGPLRDRVAALLDARHPARHLEALERAYRGEGEGGATD